MIVFRTIENHTFALENALAARLTQIALAEFRRDHARLHDGEIEQVALEDEETGPLLQRLVIRQDHIAVGGFPAFQIFRHGLACHGRTVSVELAGLQKLPHDGGRAAGAVIFLTQPFAGRLDIGDERNVVTVDLPVLLAKLHTRMFCHGRQMRLGVGGTADCRVDADRVQKCLSGHDVGGLDVLDNQLDGTAAGAIGHLAAFTVSGGNGTAAGERHAERLRHGIHGRRRTHGVAMADGRSGFERCLQEFLAGDFASAIFAAHAPDDSTGTDQIPIMVAVEHRPAGKHDGRNIDRACRHQR